jgi:Leucine-rich repeat (LRR) protein
MDCFDDCTKLQKLYLEGNQISKLEGLTNCTQLKEIYIGNQKTRVPFTFDEYSLAAISASLVLLDMPKVNLVECRSLYFLEHLYQLNL